MLTFTIDNLEVRGLPLRQAQTLALTAQGNSSKEVARRMSISPRTVEMNLTLTMLRLKARNRTHLITQAVIDGVLRIRETAATVALCLVLALVTNGHIADSDNNAFARRTTRSVRRKDDSTATLLHDFD